MTKETLTRVISAVVLLTITGFCIYFGRISASALAFLVAILLNDEIICNLLKRPRFSIEYIFSQGSLIFLMTYFLYLEILEYLLPASIALNICLLGYFFFYPTSKPLPIKVAWPSGIFTLLQVLPIFFIIQMDQWLLLSPLLIVTIYSMDSGAWLFGRFFGKHKLHPKVSPHKTWEGLIGGLILAALVGGFALRLMLGISGVFPFLLSAILGLVSHLGDLTQSKIKRQCAIKDSSSLIPGHGGVYDRLDSLLFIAPFFILSTGYFY